MTRFFSTMVVVLLCVGIAFAGTGVEKKPLAVERQSLAIDRNEDLVIPAPGMAPAWPSLMKTSAITWTMVDSCPNVYGQGNSNSWNYWYDEDLDAHVIIHRGNTAYSPGSGYLWYNLSTDGGATWPRFGDLNAGNSPNWLRYPSVFISNPTASSNISDALLVFAAPSLDIGAGGGFGSALYGVDFPLGGGAAVSFLDFADSSLGTGFSVWQDGPNAVWTVDAGGDGTAYPDGSLWRWWTTDFVTVTSDVPAGLDFTGKIPSNTWGLVHAHYAAGKSYVGYQGRFEGTDVGAWPNFGYTTSTDNGATWSAWSHPTSIYDLGFGNNVTVDRVPTGIAADFVVDKDGYPHYFCVLVDTTTNVDFKLIEVYETASGWAANTVKDGLNPACELFFGGLDQTSWGVRAATDAAGEVIAVAWIDAATSAADDSLADVWFAARSVSGSWSTAENLTQSPDLPELILHAAPRLKTGPDNTYTMFFNVSTDKDNPTEPSDVGFIYLWFGSHTFNVATDVRELPGVPETYALEQNYPNPFNPTTNIVYSVPQSTFVTLKVYDILGSEVATLVNEVQSAGNYTVDFNAADLANGAYFYRLTAGSFTDVKKMVLMK